MIEINGITIGNESYPNQETIFKSISKSLEGEINLTFKYKDDSDISKLIIIKKYLDDLFPDKKVDLIMKYIPYSRMDRQIEGYMFSCKYFCQVINDMKFNKVIVLDPHSAVSIGILDRVREIPIQPYIDKIIQKNKIDYVFYPDNGAYKKYPEKISMPEDIAYFYGNKKRNLQTGYIERYDLVEAPELNGKNVLIIDDICSKGMTFFLSGKEIKSRGAKNVYLYVSHLEETVKEGNLLRTDIIDKIYTSDSMVNNYNEEKIEVIHDMLVR